MADVEWVIDGDALKALFESDDGPTAKLLKRVGTKCVSGAKRLAPVDTGRLRASISEELRHDGEGLVEVVGTDVDYAPYVELGTVHQHAQPFLLPAAQQAKP
jgi:HK97 gp10 family phage protein